MVINTSVDSFSNLRRVKMMAVKSGAEVATLFGSGRGVCVAIREYAGKSSLRGSQVSHGSEAPEKAKTKGSTCGVGQESASAGRALG